MFRMTIAGTFDSLDDAGRAKVLAVSGPGYTDAGAFTHDATITAFTFRVQVAAEDESEATQSAFAALDAYALPYHTLRVAATDMNAIKIKRRP